MAVAWIAEVAKSEFLWGLVAGVTISFFTAIFQMRLARRAHRQMQKEEFSLQSTDIVNNLSKICDDIKEARRRSNLIHPDLMGLLDEEFQAYLRIRDRSFVLPDDVRGELNQYITQCRLRRVSVGMSLARHGRHYEIAEGLEKQQSEVEAQTERNAGTFAWADANKALDDMLQTVSDGRDKMLASLRKR